MSKKIDAPLLSLWFGNFYRPAYDDPAFVEQSVRRMKSLGFNCVELDSKDWQDFRDRFDGGEPSPYVAMQEHMMDVIRQEDMGYMFLALYLNGDNLYPDIRFSPPVHGDSVVNPDGSDGRWYRYWSQKAQRTMTAHVRQLMDHYPEGMAAITADGKEVLPLCSMWDPIAAPSFDSDGMDRYRQWLRQRWGSIEAFNAACDTHADSFEQLMPGDYWYPLRYGEQSVCTPEEISSGAAPFMLWADRMRWLADELTAYFKAMKERLHGISPALYLMPNLTQWSHFINVDTSAMPDVGFCDLWDTAMRGIDLRAIAPHVDMAHWFCVPVTMDGEPDAYAVGLQHAQIRALNPDRGFIGGVFWGRFLYNDIYRWITPEEIIGDIVASGAQGISAYGWGGMDDGGILHCMDEGFLSSLRRGNLWAGRVIPELGARKRSHAAILFPRAMAMLEPLRVQGAAWHRSDLLGIYRLCCDCGYAPDILETADLSEQLGMYDVLLLPADTCYHAWRDPAAEEAIRRYVRNGGTVIHSSLSGMAEAFSGLHGDKTDDLCYTYANEGGLLTHESFRTWPGEAVARWEHGGAAVSVTELGNGRIIHFGFNPGAQYIARKAPHVPRSQGNNELYPLSHMRHNVLADLLRQYAAQDCPWSGKDVCFTAFEHGILMVNHRGTPVDIPPELVCADGQQTITDSLPAHSAVWLKEAGR